MTSPLEHIETRIAYLERANTELSDVVYRQARELDDLRARLSGVLARVDAAQGGSSFSAEEEKPPHY